MRKQSGSNSGREQRLSFRGPGGCGLDGSFADLAVNVKTRLEENSAVVAGHFETFLKGKGACYDSNPGDDRVLD